MKERPPGLLRPGARPDVVMMICTAGHVDHGKTSLVKMLTGCETDRLREEKERGMTIEVGFAPCWLGDGLAAGIADVPGHERFIRTMVAGVSGIDLAILVVAADDGVMPQTEEHTRIMELLGVRDGIVALTKTDLVVPERIEAVTAELRRFLAGTFLAQAPICPVSSRTGEGFFPFYELLVQRVRGAARRRAQGVFRMPIDRVFIRPGIGTVVTGIPVAGDVRVGDAVEAVPGGFVGRVRGMERFTREAEAGGAGQCLALVVPELTKTPPERGQSLCIPGHLAAYPAFHIHLLAVPVLDPPLRNGEAITFHTGRSEEPGRLLLLEGETHPGGASTLATVVLERPVAAAAYDRFLLRRPSPSATVGGGTILDALTEGRRPRRKEALARLRAQMATLAGAEPGSPEGIRRRLLWHLQAVRTAGATTAELARENLLQPAVAGQALRELAAAGGVLDLSGEAYIHPEAYRARRAQVEARLHQDGAGQGLSVDLSRLRQGLDWPAPLWQRLQEELERDQVASFKGSRVVSRRAVAGLSPEDQELMESILRVYEETGFNSPRPDELPELLRAEGGRIQRLLEALCAGGELIRLTRLVIVSLGTFRAGQAKVVEIIQRDGFLDSALFKNEIGSSRKYALALLDFLDMRHITVRTQHNNRKLAADHRKRLL